MIHREKISWKVWLINKRIKNDNGFIREMAAIN